MTSSKNPDSEGTYSLTPGRYVGAAESDDPDEPFEDPHATGGATPAHSSSRRDDGL